MTPDLSTVRRAIRRVRRRVVLQSMADRLVVALILAAGAWVVGLHALRLGWLPPSTLDTLPLVVAGIAASGLLAGLLTRISDVAAAKRLDDASELRDRLAAATSFAREATPTPFMLAAMADAVAHVGQAVPKRAAPLRAPRHLLALLAVVVGAGATVWIEPPLPGGEAHAVRRSTPLRPPRIEEPRLATPEQEALDQTLERLAETLKDIQGEQAAALLKELEELIEDVKQGRATGREVFERLARLEDKAQTLEESELARHAEVEKRLRDAAKELQTKATKELKGLKEALERGDLGKASEELQKLAEQDRKDKKDRDQLAKELQKLADALKDPKQDTDAVKKEVDRLQKKKDAGERMSKREEDRLQKKKKELEQLARQQQQQSPSQKSLERLTRDMQSAADELRRQKGGQGENQDQDALSRAAEEMRRLSRQGAQQKAVKVARVSMEEMRELLRRARQAGQGEGKEGPEGEPRPGDKKKGQRGKLQDFYTRAGGEKPGQKGQGKEGMTLGEGTGKKGEMVVMEGQGGKGQKMDMASGSDAPGDEHDPNLLGKDTKLDAKRQDTFVAGQKQEGTGRSETIQGAASQGFTGTAWRKVHHDYSGVVEEDMEKEQIPRGTRRYVQRYFDLIRPR